MSHDRDLFIFIATYSSEEGALADYEMVKDLHTLGAVGTYDAAIIRKDEDGNVHLRKHEKPTQHGAEAGVVVGAVAGILFPPSIIVTAAVGGVAGGLVGHFWRGMSRHDVKELGELIDDGEASLLVVGESKLEEFLDRAITRADKRIAKEIKGSMEDYDRALAEATKEG